MPMKGTIVSCLIASPSDCAAERELIPELMYAWNAANTLSTDTLIEPVKWETHAIPELGDRPQALINRRLVDWSDILVGVFWTRLGTDTGIAASGTAEEIERFRASGRRVLLYFSMAPIQPDRIDPEQHSRLVAYKKEIQKLGIAFEYESLEQLKDLFVKHLAIAMGELIKAQPAATAVAGTDSRERLGNLLALAYKYVDAYVKYSQSPPAATYDQFAASEDALKTYLFENRLRISAEFLDIIESLINKARSYIDLGNKMPGLWGGDGRPRDEDLTGYQRELMNLLKGIEERFRASGHKHA